MITILLAFTLIAVGNYLDYATTRYAISRGAKEMNPFINLFGLRSSKIIGTFVLTWIAWLSGIPDILSCGILLFFIVLAVHNVRSVNG